MSGALEVRKKAKADYYIAQSERNLAWIDETKAQLCGGAATSVPHPDGATGVAPETPPASSP